MKFQSALFFLLLILAFRSVLQAAECEIAAIAPQQFSEWDVPGDPWGVAVDPQGFVFVTDPINDRICRYSLDGGTPLYFGSTGNEDGEFMEPHWVAFDPVRARLYVVDNINTPRVQAFDRNGTHLFTIGGFPLSTAPGSFAGHAHGLALDANGNIFVADGNTLDSTFFSRIQVFGPGGLFQRVFAEVPVFPAVLQPGQWRSLIDIEVTPDGDVFLLDTGVPGFEENRVHRLGIDGLPIGSGLWGTNGNEAGEFDYPFGFC